MHRAAPPPRGQIVLLALVFFGIFVGVTTSFIALLLTSERAERVRVAQAQAHALAEAGIDKAVYELNQNSSYAGETGLALGNGMVTTVVTTIDSSTKKIAVESYVPNSTSPVATQVLTSEVAIDTSVVSFRFGVQVGEGGLLMDNNSIVNGNIFSDGNISGGGKVTGDATVAGGTAGAPDQVWTIENGSFNLGDVSAHADVAQSFKPSASTVLNSVSLYLKKVGSPGDITLKIVEDDSGEPSKTVLASGSLAASGISTTYGFVSGTLTSAPSLTAGVTYWIIAIASVNASNYFVWGSDTTDAYTNGTATYSSDWNAGNPVWTALGDDLDFKTYMGGVDTSLSGVHVEGDAWAHNLSSCDIDGDASYQGTNSCEVLGAEFPGTADATPVDMPITAAQITDWETAAAATPIAGPYTISTPQSLGPAKIEGDLTLDSQLTLLGPVWVDGDITFLNGSSLTVASSLGNNGAVLLADAPGNTATKGVVVIGNDTIFSGNGNSGSYPMVLSTNTSDMAIDQSNGSSNAIVYASAGTIVVKQTATANQITAYRLHLNENAIVNYINGLAQQSFANGPGGSWIFVSGSYGSRP